MLVDMRAARDLTTRELTPADAPEVTEVIAACEVADSGVALIELEDIVADWKRPGFTMSQQTIGYFDDARMAACGEVHRSRSESYVHPAYRDAGIGTELVLWSQRTAVALGYGQVGQTVNEQNTAAVSLFERRGYTRLYSSWVLELPPETEIAPVELGGGYRLRGVEGAWDERAAYDVIEGAFSVWPDREDRTFEDWSTTTTRRDDYEPWHLSLAIGPGEQVAGACYASPVGDIGWVDQVAVAEAHRGRGLAQALLVRAFGLTREHGAPRAQLNTDSRTGALGLYEHVGMRVVDTFVHFARVL
ncbi:MAG: GNAT family N-acetyltransferase [Nocardioidaceae bacterium]